MAYKVSIQDKDTAVSVGVITLAMPQSYSQGGMRS